MTSNSNTNQSSVPKVVGGIIALLLCCTCALIVLAGAIIYWGYQQSPTDMPFPFPTIESGPTVPPPTPARPP
ncbi:MAG TPA: hypothetical protein VNK49_07615, partial [Anaerolineales bacterium]|nr:hypothetical protein [Anaerolineales bacterium]